jgi:hypothetical protein
VVWRRTRCPKCYVLLRRGDTFCPSCGARVLWRADDSFELHVTGVADEVESVTRRLAEGLASSRLLGDKGFQDGASIGFVTRIGHGSWQVQLGGAPVACTEVRFFPQAVLIAWSLPADTAGFGCGGSQPPRTAPTIPLAVDPILRAS